MTEQPPPAPEPTTVVGYPGAVTPPAAPYANPGIASLRGAVRGVRYLVLACLGLLIVIAVGLGVALASSRAQMDDLTAQVSALSAQVDAVKATGQTADTGQAAADQADAVKQLGPAAALDAGITLPAGVDASGAVLIGDPEAANVVEVYIDYQCPFCQRWEETIGRPLAQKAMQPGSDLLIKQYNLAFLGETNASLEPAGASARAASAAACVLDNDGTQAFVAFSQSVFATADPNEPPGQFTPDVLTDLATKAGASDATISCIEKETHVPFVAATTKAGFGRGVGGTPTVVVNGTTLGNPFTDAALTDLVG